MGHTYRGAKSGCKLVTEFDSYSYDGVSAGIWVIHTGAKSGGEVVTLFDSYLMTHESVYGSPSLVNEYFWL